MSIYPDDLNPEQLVIEIRRLLRHNQVLLDQLETYRKEVNRLSIAYAELLRRTALGGAIVHINNVMAPANGGASPPQKLTEMS